MKQLKVVNANKDINFILFIVHAFLNANSDII